MVATGLAGRFESELRIGRESRGTNELNASQAGESMYDLDQLKPQKEGHDRVVISSLIVALRPGSARCSLRLRRHSWSSDPSDNASASTGLSDDGSSTPDQSSPEEHDR